MNVARSWTRAWAIMKGIDIPDALPEAFIKKHRKELGKISTLSDPERKIDSSVAEHAQQLAASMVARIKETVFPLVGV